MFRSVLWRCDARIGLEPAPALQAPELRRRGRPAKLRKVLASLFYNVSSESLYRSLNQQIKHDPCPKEKRRRLGQPFYQKKRIGRDEVMERTIAERLVARMTPQKLCTCDDKQLTSTPLARVLYGPAGTQQPKMARLLRTSEVPLLEIGDVGDDTGGSKGCDVYFQFILANARRKKGAGFALGAGDCLQLHSNILVSLHFRLGGFEEEQVVLSSRAACASGEYPTYVLEVALSCMEACNNFKCCSVFRSLIAPR